MARFDLRARRREGRKMADSLVEQAKENRENGPKYQAKEYREGRPNYPNELFQFISSKTPLHHLAWDAATGSGQAAQSLASIYKNVIATDMSSTQLDFAHKLPNIRYQQTPATMSIAELETKVAAQASVDLVTVATALHWLDLPNFYQQVKWVLKKPHGVIAAWTYTALVQVNTSVDPIIEQYYSVDCKPHWHSTTPGELVENKYKSIYFPFEPVDGTDNTGPFEFLMEREMELDDLFTLFRSWSAYSAAKEKGVELLNSDVIGKFMSAWNQDGCSKKVVKFPIYLRMGKVGNLI